MSVAAAMPRRAIALACLALVASFGAKAQTAPSAPRPFVEEIQQQERAVDGAVGGRSARELLGNHLAGVALGVRGAFKGLNYDLFVATPIAKPEGYRTAKVTGGVSLNFGF